MHMLQTFHTFVLRNKYCTNMAEYDFDFTEDDIMLPDVQPAESEVFPDTSRFAYMIDMSEFVQSRNDDTFDDEWLDQQSLQRYMDVLLGSGQSRVYIFKPMEYITLADERKVDSYMKHDINWLLTGEHFRLSVCHICVEFNLEFNDIMRWLRLVNFLTHHCAKLHGIMNVYKNGKKVVDHVSSLNTEEEIDAVLRGRYVIRNDYRSLRTESPNGMCVVNKEYPKNFSYVYLTLKDDDILRNYVELYEQLDCIQRRIRKQKASMRMVLTEESDKPVPLIDDSELPTVKCI